MRRRATPKSIEERQRELERLREEIERSRDECERLREENARLERERDRLRREIERLSQALEAARRAGKRQAAPFSKGAPTAHPGRAGRRAGRRHGRHGHRRPPGVIDERIDVPLPDQCPDCGGGLTETRIAIQIQEDLPVVRPHVRQFDVHVGRCDDCGRRVQGRHPLQTSDALGAASTHLGPHAVALIVLLNKQLGLSHGKVAALLRDWFGLRVWASGVTHALHRAARHAAPTYDALREQVRGSPMVSPDEASWKVGGQLWWLWVFATARTVVYAIQHGRGFDEAAAVLGAEFDGVLVRDGWAPYRQFEHAAHQTCLAHLIRRCGEITDSHPRAQWPRHVQTVLQNALAVRDRLRAGEISAHGAAVARGQLLTRLLNLLAAPGRLVECARLAAHLTLERPALFGFLFDVTLDATNWRAEQAIRPMVVNRKVSGGNRSARGAETQQILSSVIQTARLRDLDPRDVLVELLRAPQPTVSPALAVSPL
ncbi:MAG: IS66 family transposase [Acidobacteriota bacterium]